MFAIWSARLPTVASARAPTAAALALDGSLRTRGRSSLVPLMFARTRREAKTGYGVIEDAKDPAATQSRVSPPRHEPDPRWRGRAPRGLTGEPSRRLDRGLGVRGPARRPRRAPRVRGPRIREARARARSSSSSSRARRPARVRSRAGGDDFASSSPRSARLVGSRGAVADERPLRAPDS